MNNTVRNFLFVCCGLLAVAVSAWAMDPSDLFLRAYQDFKAGEKLERDGSPREAFAKYQSAAKLLEELSKSQPDWQPPVVDYRLKKTRENLSRLESAILSAPSVGDGPEGALPQGEIAIPPPAINTTQPLTPRSPAALVRQPVVPQTARAPAPPSETAALRQQLASARADNDRLQDRLTRQAAELQSALLAVDKTKVTVVELKAQLAQAQDAMQDAIRDREERAALPPPVDNKQLAELNSQIAKAEADNEALIEENQRLLAKLERATAYISVADESRKILEGDRKKVAQQRDEAVARTKRIKDNTATIEKLQKEKEDLTAQFSQERQALEKKLAAAPDPAELQKLAAENKDLAAKLAESEMKLADAKSKPGESEKIIADLRSEVNSLNDRILTSQSQLASRDEQIKALARQLDESTGEIARLRLNPQPSADEKRTMVENDLLRGIIMRQIKEQSERDVARLALEKEIQNLQVKSDTITKQLDVLSRPAFQLNDDERLLFKEPLTMLSEPDSSSMAVSMAVAKPGPAAVVEGPESLPDDSRAKVDTARQLFSEGRFSDAEQIYQEIVDSAPNNSFALSNLGVTQIQSKKLSAAEVALRKAIAINPADAFAATNLGIVYTRQGRFDDAIMSLQEAASADPNDHVAQNYLGICYGETGQREKSEAAFKRSIEIREDYPDAHFNLSVLYATSQPPNFDLARQHYERAVALGSAPDASLERLFKSAPPREP